ncbi:MAG: hypothetical protein ACREUQ_03610 [Burkholderiales bacterium]
MKMRGILASRFAAFALLLVFSGCATIQAPQRVNLVATDPAIRACAILFRDLDRAVRAAAVSDLGARPVSGFPYLRADRFTASFSVRANEAPAAFEQWVGRMRELDAEGRQIEISNLPDNSFAALSIADRQAAITQSETCAARLLDADLGHSGSRSLLFARAHVPDDYSSAKRALGLYALVQLPFAHGVETWQKEATENFRRARAGELPDHPVIRYVPDAGAVYSRDEVAALLARAADNPLKIPRLNAEQRERLFTTYAPVFEIETTGDYDRIGALYWGDSTVPRVRSEWPVVYRKLAYTRVGEATLLQLVYVAWTSERPSGRALDLLAGRLDGLVWRVTLAPDAEPILFDSMHPCGCFHMFFPTPRVDPIAAPKSLIEWAFSPAGADRVGDGERLVLKAQTRTHYLRDVAIDSGAPGVKYRFEDYDTLRSLPTPSGVTRSVFGPDGIVRGSERAERFLFWPMGVASAGAMRQWGTHATAFVGRRHFDDADLIERRFRIARQGTSE